MQTGLFPGEELSTHTHTHVHKCREEVTSHLKELLLPWQHNDDDDHDDDDDDDDNG